MIRTFFFLFSISVLYANIEDHLKKITNKPTSHQIRNIDFIYMINLDVRPEKYDLCLQQLAPYGIIPYRFSAINGWELPLQTINDIGVNYEPWMEGNRLGTYFTQDVRLKALEEMIQTPGRTYFCQYMYLGTIGCTLSHLSVLQDAFDSGFETIWVMEDDIEIIENPHILSDLIDQLDDQVGKTGWDVLFTDQDTKGKDGSYVPALGFVSRPNFTPADPPRFFEKKAISSTFRKIGARFGAYSMILRRSGIKKILNFLKNYNIFLPYDMEYTLPNGIRLYTVLSDIVSTQPRALSDNGSPNYLKK